MNQQQQIEQPQRDNSLTERVMQECYAACGIW